MCDKCGNVFSERSDDWGTFGGTRMVRDKDTGERKQVHEMLDICGECNVSSDIVRPMIASIHTDVS